MTDTKVICDGDRVILKTDEKTKVFQLFKQRQIFFDKIKFKGNDVIGQSYGTQFEVQQGKLVVVKPQECSGRSQSAIPVTESGKDNRDLVQSGGNQKLSQEDILKMKEQGISGQDIIGRLVEHSETFKTKTEFSQEKYIKKKKKKHMLVFRVLRPTAALLLDAFKNQPAKICNLRSDSLSQLLNYSNVCWGWTVAVVESCQGLVVGAVMERMGASGRVLHLYPGNDMNRQVVGDFNFSKDHMDMLLGFPLNKLAALENGTLVPTLDSAVQTTDQKTLSDRDSSKTSQDSSEAADKDRVKSSMVDDKRSDGAVIDCNTKSSVVGDSSEKTAKSARDKDKSAADMEVDDDGDDDKKVDDDDDENCGEGGAYGSAAKDGKARGGNQTKNNKRNLQRYKLSPAEQEARKQERNKQLLEVSSVLQERQLDSLIIATKHDPVSLLLRLLPYVAPSSPVVVYCQHKEPLVECYSKVKEGNMGVQVRLAESWYREYQVLPSRTHPVMNMTGTGGYLLSFNKVTANSASEKRK